MCLQIKYIRLVCFWAFFTVPSSMWAAGIDGKSLICKCEGCEIDLINHIHGWSFVDGVVAHSYFIIHQDRVRIQKKPPMWPYKTDENKIEWDVAGTNFKLSRSTLDLVGYWGINKPIKCLVYQSRRNFDAELSRIQSDLQLKYNKKLDTNKI